MTCFALSCCLWLGKLGRKSQDYCTKEADYCKAQKLGPSEPPKDRKNRHPTELAAALAVLTAMDASKTTTCFRRKRKPRRPSGQN